MKKHIIILATIFAAALLATGCEPEGNDLKTKAPGLTISLYSGEPQTKADDPFAFESAIHHFDFFFFKDEAGTQPMPGMHNRVEGSTTTLDTSENGAYYDLRKGGYVYILANYPGTINHRSDWVLSDLLALEFESKIATKETAVDPDTGETYETGNVIFCDNLVMDSYTPPATTAAAATYTVKLTPTQVEQEGEYIIKLRRIAAKLQMKINVKDKVKGSMNDEWWTPVMKDLHVYYVNALNNRSTVKGTPIDRNRDIPEGEVANYEYLTYPTNYRLTPDPAAFDPANPVYQYATDPVYTYPQVWKDGDNGEPYFKIQMTWESNFRGTNNFYYKVTVPKPVSFARTLNRNYVYTVTLDLSVLDTENEYVNVEANYFVADWVDSGFIGGNDLEAAKFFNVPVRSYELYNQEDLSIPYYSSSSVSVFFKQIKFDYYGTNEGATYTYNFTDESTSSITLPNTDSNGQTVANAARDLHPYSVSIVGKTVLFEHELSNIFTVREVTVCIKKSATEYADVTIRQHPAIEIKKHPTMNMFINGWFGHVKEPKAADGTPFARNDYNVYTDRYGNTVSKSTKGKSEHGSNWGTITYIEKPADFFGYTGNYGALATNNNTFISEPYITEVVVSAFSATNKSYKIRYGGDGGAVDVDITNPSDPQDRDYMIGDPRVKASSTGLGSGWLKSGYLYKETYSGSSYTEDIRSWTRPEDIMIASTAEDHRNFIAPRFLLASTLNVTNGITYEGAKRRAAVYQEEGYPAGRWRRPTEAEICFIIDRQNDGSLPQLLRKNQYYWSADGNVIYTGDGGTTIPGSAPRASNKTAPLRFVYDLWYWGDADPNLETNVYHPNMHLEPNN